MRRRWLVSVAIALGACSILGPTQSAEELAATMVAGTQASTGAEEQSPTQPPPTDPPTAVPTNTPIPEPTDTPLPEGPVSVEDDFSGGLNNWFDCEHCKIENGKLQMGPFPVAYAYEQQWALCGPCGMVTTFHLAVDVSFVGGPSERGFGLVLGLNNEEFYTYEVTPWQTLDFWHYDYEVAEWNWVNGMFVGSVRTGNQANRIEVEAAENASGRIDYSLIVNGRTPIVIFNRQADPGWVGMTLYGHAVELLFDNFTFETEETPVFPAGRDTFSG